MSELREQAEFVAEKLLGWERPTERSRGYWWDHVLTKRILVPLDRLSTWQGAGEIIEAMRKTGLHFDCVWIFGIPATAKFSSHILDADSCVLGEDEGETLPEAILRAAYAALKES